MDTPVEIEFAVNLDDPHFGIVTKGGSDTTKSKKISKIYSSTGFNESCYMMSCPNYLYVVTLKNKQIKIITTLPDFIKFLGKIDNIYEAIQVASFHGFIVGSFDAFNSTCRRNNDTFEFYAIKVLGDCDSDLYLITIKQTGEFSEKRIGKYKYSSPNHCPRVYGD
jgi:hypothetical protein